MSKRISAGDRVIVTTGTHKGKTGKADTKRSNFWDVFFDRESGGGHAQIMAAYLVKVEVEA